MLNLKREIMETITGVWSINIHKSIKNPQLTNLLIKYKTHFLPPRKNNQPPIN